MLSAEQAVIGAALMEPAALDTLRLEPDAFDDRRHRELYRAMLNLHREHRPVGDAQLVIQQINGTSAEWVGGLMSDCISAVPEPGNVAFYAEAVSQNYQERRLRAALAEIASDQRLTAAEMLTRAERIVAQLRPALRPEDRPPPPTVEDIFRSDAFKAPQATFASGFAELDRLLDGGFKARQVTCIAGPPGGGKSALAGQFSRALAQQMPVLVISTELDGAEVAARAAAPLINCRPSELLSLTVSTERAAAAVCEMPIYVAAMDDMDLDVDSIRAIEDLAKAVAKHAGRMPAVVIDYMQELASDDPEGRRMSVSRVAKQLRRMSRRLDTPFIVLSSTSRANYGPGRAVRKPGAEEDPRAWLAAAKESGDIEYACAVFMFLDVDNRIGPTGESFARLIVAKSRRGIPGFVGLRFHGPTGHFFSAAQAVEEMGVAKRENDLEQRIIDAIKGATKPITKENLPRLAKANRTETLRVIRALLDAGVVELRETRRADATGRIQKIKVLVLTEQETVNDLPL